ncbi:MAG: DUF4860 domain-containing protein [Lachnospiraceae bacterium]|nr:DUF4860 domain-containing protein [Lachnospiraceae bacterium]
MNKKSEHTVDALFVITLFLVFAISVVALTGTGAGVYQNVVDKMSSNYNSRTSFSYIYNKVHQSDMDGLVDVGQYMGNDALIISEEIDNITYCTYLYEYDGNIKELFTRAGQEFDPSYGTDILEVEGFSISKVTDSLYRFDIKPVKSADETLFVHVRSLK